MKQLEALTISIGVLGAVDTWFTAVVIPLPVWVTFIAWASFVDRRRRHAGLDPLGGVQPDRHRDRVDHAAAHRRAAETAR